MLEAEMTYENDNLLTPDEVADWLGVKVHTLAQWRTANRGRRQHILLPFFKVGRSIRYSRDDVNEWLTKSRDAWIEKMAKYDA